MVPVGLCDGEDDGESVGKVLPFQLVTTSTADDRLATPLPGLDAERAAPPVEPAAFDLADLGEVLELPLPAPAGDVRALCDDEVMALLGDAQVLQPALLGELTDGLLDDDPDVVRQAISDVRTAAFAMFNPAGEELVLSSLVKLVVQRHRPLTLRRQAALAISEAFGRDAVEIGHLDDAGLVLCLQAEPGLPLGDDELIGALTNDATRVCALMACAQTGCLPAAAHDVLGQALQQVDDDGVLRDVLRPLLSLLSQASAETLLTTLMQAKRVGVVMFALRFAPHLLRDEWVEQGLHHGTAQVRSSTVQVIERCAPPKALQWLLPHRTDADERVRQQVRQVIEGKRRSARSR